MLKVRNEFVWLWIAIEPIDKIILGIRRISFERTMLVAERFLQELVRKYGKHPVSTDGGTWYPQTCKFLNMNNHHLHSSYEKSMIERTIQYIKRIEPKALMTTTFLVEKKNVNYNISEIGSIFSLIIIIRR